MKKSKKSRSRKPYESVTYINTIITKLNGCVTKIDYLSNWLNIFIDMVNRKDYLKMLPDIIAEDEIDDLICRELFFIQLRILMSLSQYPELDFA